jgi:hypothetical protein
VRQWLTIGDLAASVTEDVLRIRSHPLVPAGIPIYGYIFHVQVRPPDRGGGRHLGRRLTVTPS